MRSLVGWFFKSISLIFMILPRRARLVLGDVIGLLWFDIFRIRRKIALENVAIAFPALDSAEHTRIARESLRCMGRTLVEYALFPFFGNGDIADYFEFRGLENLDRALAQNKGVIALSLHLGNGDFATAALSRRGYSVQLISKEFKAKWLNDLWFGMRRKHGTHFISPEKSSFEILRSLKRKEIVIFVLDQFMGPPIGVRTKFFGKETGTAAGLALMAIRTGAPVVPMYTYREPDGRHTVVIEPPVPMAVEGLTDQNIAVMTQTYTDKIEAIVSRYPEQWMWIHRRWKEFRD